MPFPLGKTTYGLESDMSVNVFNNICLPITGLQITGSVLEYNLQRYFFPAVALFGIFGNILNLTVLLNKNMRNRANTILSVLAIADILFLTLLFPNILANYSTFYLNNTFRFFYFHAKIHVMSLANWCSSIAIWCVILVCADRLIGIRNPLYVRGGWGKGRLAFLLSLVIFVTGAFTAYQHVEYHCIIRWFCNEGTQLIHRCLPINNNGSWFKQNDTNPYSLEFRRVLAVSRVLHATTMILFPIFLLALLNILLLCVLRQRQRHLAFGAMPDNRKSVEQAFQKTEHRVTLTVSCIVTMFTLTNGPSAIDQLLRSIFKVGIKENYDWSIFFSTLVICGKASNFILFCLGSKHFRIRLIKLAQRKVHRRMEMISTSLEKSRSRRQSAPSTSSTPPLRKSSQESSKRIRAKSEISTPLLAHNNNNNNIHLSPNKQRNCSSPLI